MGQKSTRRARRAAVTGGVLAASLVAVAPASAALGGANPASYNHVPDLRSVTFGSSGPDKIAWFTFDEPLASNAIDPAQFTLGGYASSDRLPTANVASVVGSKPNTVELRWTSTSPDFDETSYGVVNAGAVRAFNGNQPNRVDSTGVTGAKGQSGTRGRSIAPNLVGVRVDESNLNANVLIYTFDQKIKVGPGGISPIAFSFLKQDGSAHNATTVVSSSDFEVAVRFPSLPGDDLVTEAVSGFVNSGANIFAKNYATDSAHSVQNTVVPVAGKSGTTTLPDLLSASLGASGGSTSVTYDFDQPVANAVAGDFLVRTSTGQVITGTSAVITADGRSVTVNFPNPVAQKSQEHFVEAHFFTGAVTTPNGTPAWGDTEAIGGNAGAFSTGWTSAPDATAATFNKSNGQVDITLDTRLNTAVPIAPGQFTLVDGNGDPIAVAGSAISAGSDGAPGPQTIRLQFLPNQVAAASAIEINGYNAGGLLGTPFNGSLGTVDVANSIPVAQSLTAGTTAAAIAPVGTAKKSLKLRRATSQAVLPAKVRKALKPARTQAQARRNARVLQAFANGRYKVKTVRIRPAAKRK
ncbi:hypothetical protein [Patulibacter defluvii]|uniref:hypothetical protein n=1 Tax=Patulibacter defluvii TaxID=3095358 RepID=UPI002A74844A|nr:hypothetical protein [Patulibacter sp. DM4]